MMDDSKFVCDTCGKDYAHKRNLKRHVTETHQRDNLFYPCSEYLCRGRFVRRSYLVKHLRNYNGMSKLGAKLKSKRVRKAEVPSYEHYYSDVTDVSEGESFFDRLDEQDVLQNNEVVQEQVPVENSMNMSESVQQKSMDRNDDSLEEICFENDKQNLNLVLDLCDSLGSFVANSELSVKDVDIATEMGNVSSERMLSDGEIVNGIINCETGLIIGSCDEGLDYDDASDAKTTVNGMTDGCDNKLDENNNVRDESDVLEMEYNGDECSVDNAQKSDDVSINGESDEKTESNDVGYDEFSEMTDGVDDDDDADDDDDDGRNEKANNADRDGGNSEDDAIVINSDDEDERTEYEVSAINLTIQRTTKLVGGTPVSMKRSMSLGYTENVNLTGATPKKLFDMIQKSLKNLLRIT